MKIVKILGGLGNQMFQYALYIALKERFPKEEVRIDTSCFRGYPLHNGFELERIFTLDFQKATWQEIAKVAYPYPNYRCWQIGKYLLPKRKSMCVEESDFAINTTILREDRNCYYDGYWQHEEYFDEVRDNIYKAFTFPVATDVQNKEAINRGASSESVGIHIRRGDYVNHPLFKGICDLDYYKSAISYLKEKVSPNLYCIFSNDISWCQEHLGTLLPAGSTIYVNWNKGIDSYRDMQLMSCCKHNVIANSSFSWWGAWLNRNPRKVVVAPERWMNMEIHSPIPQSWVKISSQQKLF